MYLSFNKKNKLMKTNIQPYELFVVFMFMITFVNDLSHDGIKNNKQ